jgi:hypothetical protein
MRWVSRSWRALVRAKVAQSVGRQYQAAIRSSLDGHGRDAEHQAVSARFIPWIRTKSNASRSFSGRLSIASINRQPSGAPASRPRTIRRHGAVDLSGGPDRSAPSECVGLSNRSTTALSISSDCGFRGGQSTDGPLQQGADHRFRRCIAGQFLQKTLDDCSYVFFVHGQVPGRGVVRPMLILSYADQVVRCLLARHA